LFALSRAFKAITDTYLGFVTSEVELHPTQLHQLLLKASSSDVLYKILNLARGKRFQWRGYRRD